MEYLLFDKYHSSKPSEVSLPKMDRLKLWPMTNLFIILCLAVNIKFTIYLFLNVSYLEFLKSAGCQTLFLLRDDRLVIIMIIAVFLFFRCLLHRNLLINGNVSYLRIFDETNVAALIIQQTKRKCVYTRAFNKSCGLVYISASKKDID